MAEAWVSIDDVAVHLGVRKDSIYRWIEGRGLPARKIGKLWRLKLSEVDSWVRTQDARGEGTDQVRRADRKGPRPTGSKGVVLVIDDDRSLRENLREFLLDEGYDVLLAADGEEGLTLLRTASPRPSLIMLDLGMPRVDGWRFRHEQMRDRELAAIPVLVMTAMPLAEVHDAVVLRKPFTLRQLKSSLETLHEIPPVARAR